MFFSVQIRRTWISMGQIRTILPVRKVLLGLWYFTWASQVLATDYKSTSFHLSNIYAQNDQSSTKLLDEVGCLSTNQWKLKLNSSTHVSQFDLHINTQAPSMNIWGDHWFWHLPIFNFTHCHISRLGGLLQSLHDLLCCSWRHTRWCGKSLGDRSEWRLVASCQVHIFRVLSWF